MSKISTKSWGKKYKKQSRGKKGIRKDEPVIS